MRPRLITLPKIILFLCACTAFGGMAFWIQSGSPLPWGGVPSTVGKIAFVSDRNGTPDLFLMDSADGANAVALTKDEADDRQPVWSPTGTELVFVSANRVSGLGAGKNPVPQLAAMEAREGASVVLLTRTSGSKELPTFGPESRIFFLDSGNLASINSDASDPEATFPPPDLRKTMQNFFTVSLEASGSLSAAEASPNGKELLLIAKLEEGQALFRFEVETETMSYLGAAQHINAHFRPDGALIATFTDGSPFPKPLVLFNSEALKNPDFNIPRLPTPLEKGRHIVALFDAEGNAPQAFELPAGPGEMRVAPDGNFIALATEEKGPLTGVFILPLDPSSGPAPKKVTGQPAREVSWSPDGTNVAYVSGDDVFTGRTDGGAPPKNLTQGKGRNSAPVWSPSRKIEKADK